MASRDYACEMPQTQVQAVKTLATWLAECGRQKGEDAMNELLYEAEYALFPNGGTRDPA